LGHRARHSLLASGLACVLALAPRGGPAVGAREQAQMQPLVGLGDLAEDQHVATMAAQQLLALPLGAQQRLHSAAALERRRPSADQHDLEAAMTAQRRLDMAGLAQGGIVANKIGDQDGEVGLVARQDLPGSGPARHAPGLGQQRLQGLAEVPPTPNMAMMAPRTCRRVNPARKSNAAIRNLEARGPVNVRWVPMVRKPGARDAPGGAQHAPGTAASRPPPRSR
jgi:hypothetical protein